MNRFAHILCATGLLGGSFLSAADLYVAPAGDDANPGSESRPFATLEAARDAARKLRQDGQAGTGAVTIWLRGGDYVRTAALELTTADAGTADLPVVWRAYKDETVRLIGGHPLTGFTPVTDSAVRARLDERVRDHVLQVDLRHLGIADLGRLRSRGFGRPTVASHCELFFEGRPMIIARWPNVGQWAKIAGYPPANAQDDGHGTKIGKLEDGFLYSGDRPRRWQDTRDLWVHGYWSWDWANSYERVDTVDLDQRLIRTAPPYGQYGFRTGQRFYFFNVLEEIDQPGEWCLDRKSGLLYFWPPQNAPGAIALISLLDQPLLKLTNVSHMTFQGLTLEATRANAVEMRGGQNNRLVGCQLRNIGNWGVRIEGGSGHGVVDCDIFDTGDGGVALSGGDRQTLTPGGHFVENCHFARQGRWSKCYVPAVLMSGVGMRASHNLIHDHPHCAILFSGNEHLIDFNEIHHIALETGDVGAIYSGRDWTYRGNRIRHNFIHHTGGVGMGSMGVYMDDCVSGTEIFGNVFYKVHWAMFIGGGRDHHVENNVFVDCDPAVRVDGRGLDKSPVWYNMVYDYMQTQMKAVPQELYRSRYPAITKLDPYYATTDGVPPDGVPPEGNVVARNICVGKWLEVGWHADQRWLTLNNNFVGDDPGFVAPEEMNFQLQPNALPLQQGFENIPVDQMGLRVDANRKLLPQ